jgi:putative oxidoreductase
MYADQTMLETVGQLLISVLFLGTGIINSTTKVKQHVDRMAAMNIPAPAVVLWIGFAMQLVGGAMVALDYRTDIAAPVLIVFTVVATAMFHRWWLVDDPLRRHFHQSFVFTNCAVVGGLLFLM